MQKSVYGYVCGAASRDMDLILLLMDGRVRQKGEEVDGRGPHIPVRGVGGILWLV